MENDHSELTAPACRYLLAALLPRLERMQAGLIGELRSGIAGDQAAMARSGALSPRVETTIEEALRILDLEATP